MESKMNQKSSLEMNRRQAIQRASLMLGAALSATTMTGVLSAQSKASKSGGKQENLNRRQFALAGALADRILPPTDTPVAVDVGVPAFIDVMLGDFLTEEESKTFVAGLASVDKMSRKSHKKRFADLSAADQDGVLREVSESKDAGIKAFYRKLRELTITGYFTSEKVMKEVLNYDFIPGAYEGCVPISETGNVVWAH